MENNIRNTNHIIIWTLLLLPTVNSVTVTVTKTEGPGKIEVKNGVKELRVDNGVSIGITCTVKGQTDLIWALWNGDDGGLAYNEQLLAPDQSRYSIDERRTAPGSADYTLRIMDIQLKDEGNYTCQGAEGLTDKVQLFVTTRPNITMITGLQIASVGDNVILQCKAEGSPTPSKRWRHTRPNNRLPNGIEGSYTHSGTIDITSIKLEDRGEYECVASNGVKHSDHMVSSRTTFIRMDYRPIVEPIFDNFPMVRAPDGAAASLVCKSMAYPRSSANDVMWYFENEQLTNRNDGYSWNVDHLLPTEEADVYEETTYSELQIAVVNNKTTGEYKCQFSNSQGSDNAILLLEIAPQEGGVADTSKSKAEAFTASLFTVLGTLLATRWFI